MIMVLLMSSCHTPIEVVSGTESGSETEEAVATIFPSVDEAYYATQTTESFYIEDYNVNHISIDYDFDEIMELLILHTENDRSRYRVSYDEDYSVLLDEMIIEASYIPAEYDYHTIRSFRISGVSVCLYEYDDLNWSESGFRSMYESFVKSDSGTIYDNVNEGYFFVDDTTVSDSLASTYLVDKCVICFNYSYNNGTVDDYQIYLDICEELGLPTCDEVTEEIMGVSD